MIATFAGIVVVGGIAFGVGMMSLIDRMFPKALRGDKR
jgi:hypothetical protein